MGCFALEDRVEHYVLALWKGTVLKYHQNGYIQLKSALCESLETKGAHENGLKWMLKIRFNFVVLYGLLLSLLVAHLKGALFFDIILEL